MSIVIVAQPHAPLADSKAVRVTRPLELGDVTQSRFSVTHDCLDDSSSNLTLEALQIVLRAA